MIGLEAVALHDKSASRINRLAQRLMNSKYWVDVEWLVFPRSAATEKRFKYSRRVGIYGRARIGALLD